MGTCNRRVQYGLKIPNRLGKMPENLRWIFFIHTVEDADEGDNDDDA